jgi:hypothetical protein
MEKKQKTNGRNISEKIEASLAHRAGGEPPDEHVRPVRNYAGAGAVGATYFLQNILRTILRNESYY